MTRFEKLSLSEVSMVLCAMKFYYHNQGKEADILKDEIEEELGNKMWEEFNIIDDKIRKVESDTLAKIHNATVLADNLDYSIGERLMAISEIIKDYQKEIEQLNGKKRKIKSLG
jgi:hypothetical protein